MFKLNPKNCNYSFSGKSTVNIFIPYLLIVSNKFYAYNILYLLNKINYINYPPYSNYIGEKPKFKDFKCVSNLNFSKNKLIFKKIFKHYLNMSITSFLVDKKVHNSFINLYIKSTGRGLVIFSIAKFYSKWVEISQYFYNLKFYNIKYTLFGTVFFKNEIFSVNWLTLSKLKVFWRYNQLLLFVTSSLNHNYLRLIYKLFKVGGFNNALVLDINYHKGTLSQLYKLNIYTMGVVPIIYNTSTVDLAIPAPSDTIFVQLFLLKFLLKVFKLSEVDRYNIRANLWVESSL